MARLEGTNLSKCNLSKANLLHANLKDANLKGATLQEAKLEGATLPFRTIDVTQKLGRLVSQWVCNSKHRCGVCAFIRICCLAPPCRHTSKPSRLPGAWDGGADGSAGAGAVDFPSSI